jgi:ribosomal-protein-alanine N-acetyltransferase
MQTAIGFASARRLRLVLLEVRRSNSAAIQLYRKLGFSVTGVRPGYYADNQEDAIEMMLTLDPLTGQVEESHDEVELEEVSR